MFETRIRKAYFAELGGALGVYIVLLLASIRFGRPLPEGVLRTIVLLSPMAGFALMLWAVARHFRRLDEYLRLQLLESWALAAAITAGLTFSYGFLETAGYPRLSMFSVWAVMGSAWGLVNIVRSMLQR